tara:strand:- start:213 stop:758 length:546 start_codon:yes stop_codon:yes gene_type:complete
MIGLLISLLIISVLFWIIIQLQSNVKKLIIWLLILGVIIYEGQQIISYNADLSLDDSSQLKSSNYKIWSPGVEKEYQEGDQAYLINFTAAWCITCQANDKIALSRPKIKEYLKQNNIEYIVADWTNKNSDILKSLESYNRNGVPLYIFWKPGMGKPSVLPAILTEQILLDSFENDIIKELN